MPDLGPRSFRTARLALVTLALAATIAVAPVFAVEIPESEVEKTTRHVVCDCGCPPQSIYDCTCGHADKLTRDIRSEMEADGIDGDAMLARWLERYGETARLVPEAKGFSLVAWLAPLLAIPLFGFLVIRFLKRASAAGPEPTAAAAAAPGTPSIDSPDRERLKKAFEEWDA